MDWSEGEDKEGADARPRHRTPESSGQSRESSVSPNRLCRRATGKCAFPVTRDGKVVNKEEEQEHLRREMARLPPSSSSSLSSSPRDSDETSTPSVPATRASSPSASARGQSSAPFLPNASGENASPASVASGRSSPFPRRRNGEKDSNKESIDEGSDES
ncbi:hypothetical protein PMAYCL1PPCAC_32745 [Pristionchus mayeri]|uniref:Uncharacterized protein n=1 Tax=Pristionchus mayeri TaxID=1317129 RepID=A0AAN5IF87_9BILA|nr:hypothetical protein PMAYCL1PPCAC_32745 [Pristionchus mayeri]